MAGWPVGDRDERCCKLHGIGGAKWMGGDQPDRPISDRSECGDFCPGGGELTRGDAREVVLGGGQFPLSCAALDG